MTREEEIRNNMKLLEISYEEATQLYEDDHSDEALPEVKEMEQKAKEMGRRYEKDTNKARKSVKRTPKPDLEKQRLIELLNYCLLEPATIDDELPFKIEFVSVANKQREITFSVGENNYSVTLVKHTKKKAPQ